MDQIAGHETATNDEAEHVGVLAEPLHVEAATPRISEMIDAIAGIGEDPAGGITRLAYSLEERRAHELVAEWLQELDCEITRDGVGNTFALRKGRQPSLPVIAVGSHLDSVPRGGRFDGVAGVVASVEMMRMFQEWGGMTEHSLIAVIFAAEEGARFREPSIGSKLLTGAITETDLERIKDKDGVTLRDAMRSVGLFPEDLPASRWDHDDVALFLELHVEQGGLLEGEGHQVGLADSISGSTRLRVTVTGRANHSGATPMETRADALMGAAEIGLALESLAGSPSYRGLRATVGNVEVLPNSTTTIPGLTTMIVDIRDTDSDRQRTAAVDVIGRARRICDRRGLSIEVELIADNSPVVLPMWVREQVRSVCEERGISHRFLSSGASHDAQVVSRIAPAGLIFVPSRDGLSHVPEEWTSPSDIARGTDVLFSSVLRIDELLASFHR